MRDSVLSGIIKKHRNLVIRKYNFIANVLRLALIFKMQKDTLHRLETVISSIRYLGGLAQV